MVKSPAIAAHSIGLESIENPPEITFGGEGAAGGHQRAARKARNVH
jgi:hypothetical protein